MGDAELAEAAMAVQQSTGSSAYLHGIDYPLEKFKKELESTFKFMKSHSKTPVTAKR
jgi:hypothetical protein